MVNPIVASCLKIIGGSKTDMKNIIYTKIIH